MVLTVDQHGSRTRPDQVPAALAALAAVPARLAFERTVGDEFQGVLDDPAALAAALEPLLRAERVEHRDRRRRGRDAAPRPGARRARTGVPRAPARRSPPPSPAPGACGPSATTDGGRARSSRRSGCGPRCSARRTDRGWEVADLVDQGLTYDEAASRLGITQSAVSQRAAAAGIAEGRRARELVEFLTRTALGGDR